MVIRTIRRAFRKAPVADQAARKARPVTGKNPAMPSDTFRRARGMGSIWRRAGKTRRPPNQGKRL